ncbi:MAG: hypothetical protein PHD51_00355 [Patescibacteria group bacterium]|nr:hypothetical protein [Patescibacteria group bacterium]MDD5490681.1 hypothetical protein [Patescibacteria group bacterium]
MEIINCPYCKVELGVEVGNEIKIYHCPCCDTVFFISKSLLEKSPMEQLLPKYPLELTMPFSELPTVEISKKISTLFEKVMAKENKKGGFEPKLK